MVGFARTVRYGIPNTMSLLQTYITKKKKKQEFEAQWGEYNGKAVENPDTSQLDIYEKDQTPWDMAFKYLNGDCDEGDIIHISNHYSESKSVVKFPHLDYMEKSERDIYNYLYVNEGEERAWEYLCALDSYILDERYNSKVLTNFTNWAGKNPGTAILGTLASVPLNLMSGIEYLENATSGNADKRSSAAVITQGLREGTKSQINSDVWDFVYDTATSGLDSLAALGVGVLTGGGSWVASGLVGASAAANTANSMIDRGITGKGQILTASLLSGAYEAVFEKISLGKLSQFAEKGAAEILKAAGGFNRQAVWGLTKEIGKQVFVNASEELLTEAANITTDYLLNGGLSDYALKVAEYYEAGYSPEEAKSKASADMFKNLTLAMAGGALQGFMFGGFSSAVGTAVALKDAKSTGKTILSTGQGLRMLKSIATEHSENPELKARIGSLDNNSSAVSVGLSANMLMEQFVKSSQAELTARLKDVGINQKTAEKTAASMISAAVNSVANGEASSADFTALGSGVNEMYASFKEGGKYGGRALLDLSKVLFSEDSSVDTQTAEGYNETALDAMKRVVSGGAQRKRNNGGSGNEIYNNGERTGRASGDPGNRIRRVFETQRGEHSPLQAEGMVHTNNQGIPVSQGGIRGLTREEANRLEKTAVKDENGDPLLVSHFTPNMEFQTFNEGDVGFHFGNDEQAENRANQKGEQGRTIKAYLAIENPIYIPKDIMSWNARSFGLLLYSENILSETEWEYVRQLCENGANYHSKAATELRRVLSEKGYDGVVYENGFEGKGKSYIAFYPEQVIIVDDGLGSSSNTANSDRDTSAFSEPDIKNPRETAFTAMQRVVSGGKRISTEAQRRLKTLGKKLGVVVEFDYDGPGNGYYQNGVIHLNPNNCKNPIKFVFKHELMHHLENSKLYDKFQKYLFEDSPRFKEWLREKGTTLAGYRNEVRARYRDLRMTDILIENGSGSEIKGANFEIVADFVGDTLFGSNEGADITSEFLSELARDNRNIFERIADWFKSLVSRLKGTEVERDVIKLQQKILRLKETVDTKKEADKGRQFSLSENQLTELKNRAGLLTKLSGAELKAKYGQEFNNDSLRELTKEEYANLANAQDTIISSNYNDRLDFIYEAIFNKKFNKRLIIGKITPSLALKLKNHTGVDYTDYNVILRAEDIRHNEHFFDNHSGIDITINDIADSILGLNDFRSLMLSDKYNGKMNGFPYVLEYNQNNKTKEAIIAYSKNRKALAVFDVYIKRSILPMMVNDSTSVPNPTSKTTKGANTSNTMVSQSEHSVNNNSMQELADNTTETLNADTKADLKESAFSMSEKGKQYSLSTEEESSRIDEAHARWKNGEITAKEYSETVAGITGAIPKGEDPKVDVTLPQKIGNRYVHRFDRTLLESGHPSPEVSEKIAKDIMEGARTFERISNKSLIADATNKIKSDPQKAVEEWMEAINKGKMLTDKQLVLGQQLMLQAVENNDVKDVMAYSAELAEAYTRAGRGVQTARLLKKLTPEGNLYYLNRAVATLNKDLEAKYKDKFESIEISPDIAEQILSIKTSKDMDKAVEDAMRDIGKQMPSTFLDKFNAWRYLAMLGNPRTHARNIFGNGIFWPAYRIKDAIGAVMELAQAKENRTKTLAPILKKEYRSVAQEYYEKIKDSLVHGRDYGYSDKIDQYRKVFKNKLLEKARRFNSEALENEDAWFLKKRFVRAMGGYLQARGIDLKTADDATLEKAAIYAETEAQKATYREASQIAEFLNKASKSDKAAVRALGVVVDGVLPFKKTPINILKRGIEYSPVGLVKSLKKGLYDLRKGKITSSEFIDGLAANFTGTGILALGMWLASQGILSGGMGDDKEDWFNKSVGEQEYAIKIGDFSYTIDWMVPASLPLFVGAEIWNLMQDDTERNTWSYVIDGLSLIGEPIVNLSMLSGLNDVFDSVSYSDNKMSEFFASALSSYMGQIFPTLGGQIARISDDTRRTNYVDKNSDMPAFIQLFWQKTKGKIPGLEQTKTEYINVWGETETTGTTQRILENTISPGYASPSDWSKLNTEVARVYTETGDSSALPKSAEKSFIINGETKYLTADEWVEYAKSKGKKQRKYAETLIGSSAYKQLDDEAKAYVLGKIYSYSGALAKTEISDYELSAEYTKVKKLEASGVTPGEYFIAQYSVSLARADTDNSGGVTKSEYLTALKKSGLSSSTQNKFNKYNK